MTPEKDPETTEVTPGFRQRMRDDLRREAALGASAGERAAVELGEATRAMALEIVPTGLDGDRVLKGHVLGMHLALPAGHLHGPREQPALLYLFADALAIRPTDDAPMSTIPLFGLHMVLPPVAVARWVYKASRIEHANMDLVKDEQHFADSLAGWTVDDFASADPQVDVHRTGELKEPLHVYEHLGYARVSVPVADGRPVRLKSSLPVPSNEVVKLWQLFALVTWPGGLGTEVPADASGGRRRSAHDSDGAQGR